MVRSLLVALLLTLALLVPNAATADGPQPFTGHGKSVAGDGSVNFIPVGFLTTGEPVTIFIKQSTGWDDLRGATIETSHRSVATYTEEPGGFAGVGNGTMTISLRNGTVLTGHFTFSLSGRVNASFELVELHDDGVFQAEGGGLQAQGTFVLEFDASVHPTVNTFDVAGQFQ